MSDKTPPSPKEYKWATYIEGRSPKHKVHRTIGQAKNAIFYTIHTAPRGGTIFELVDGEWAEVYSYEQDFTCVICGIDARVGVGDRDFAVQYDYRETGKDTRLAHYSCKKEQETL